MLYFQLKGYELKIGLDGFVDEFESRHDRIKLHLVYVDMKFQPRWCRDLCENRIAHCLFV